MSTRSVVTAMQALEAVANAQPIGLSELSRVVDVPKATVYRSLVTLEELGWLSQEDGKWSLTVHAYAVASHASRGNRIREATIGPLSSLQLATSETVHLTVPDGRNMVVTERLDTPHALRAFLALGSQLPMHASGTGIAYLSRVSDAELERFLHGPFEARTPDTVVDAAALRALVMAARERGYSINEQGLSVGITSLGAPVLDRGERVAAAISISGPSSRITPERYEEYGRRVRDTAREASLTLQRLA